MKMCRFCEKQINDQDKICGNCGYDPQTDTISTTFVKKDDKEGLKQKQGMFSSRIKGFMFWGMIIIICTLGIMYQGVIKDVIWKIKNKSTQTPDKAKHSLFLF